MIYFCYGAAHTFVDVTAQVFAKCLYGDRVYIPAGDTGAAIFADPLPGLAKGILVIREEDGVLRVQSYGPNERVWISLAENELPLAKREPQGRQISLPPPTLNTKEKVAFFQSQLRFAGGDIRAEWVEQMNSVDFLDPNAKVLELGSGFGRNTLMISSILNDESNLVTLECNSDSVKTLRENRSANNMRFHIEAAALSYRKLMYNPSLALTIPGDVLREGYEWIHTITFDEINEKYGIDFDTLVADCEGALYFILKDNERLLENIRTIMLESDYPLAEHKWAVEGVFEKFGFRKVKAWSLNPPTADLPPECMASFWEVWTR